MRLEETNEGAKQRRLAGPRPQLVCPDSGQVDEPLSPPHVAERCRKCGERQGEGIIWLGRQQVLDTRLVVKEANWRRS